MIRFFEGSIEGWEQIDITISLDSILPGENVWEDGKGYFRNNMVHAASGVMLLPVRDEKNETICFAYMDDEANRELRMLKELEACENALQMRDVFPGIEEVVLVGCNELAYYFAEYLKKQYINVTVAGKYWEWFGYKSGAITNLDSVNKIVVYAEGHKLSESVLYKKIIGSVSSEFECIDKIYETNVRAGIINDAEGGVSEFLGILKDKRVVILGTDEKSQDVYDFLYSHGIDIYCFAKQENRSSAEAMLGKRVMKLSQLVYMEKNAVFIDCHCKNSALGNKDADMLDYYGYARNKLYFMVNDYTDIPFSNLVHVLRNKCVYVTGDKTLCYMLKEYLDDVEQGEVDVRYFKLSKDVNIEELNILFLVYPWYGYGMDNIEHNPILWKIMQEIQHLGNKSYSAYFSRTASLAIIDQYINRGAQKYSIRQLVPKGILLGRIPRVSGNVFLRSVLDGHPDIIKWGYNRINSNLFLYCVRLAKQKAEKILRAFKKIFMEELIVNADSEISNWYLFEQSVKKYLLLKDNFSSQELFVIFNIAYAEMMSREEITDIGNKIIYWEPHHLPRNEFPYLARWLEDEKINGQTIYLHRDNIVWVGSNYKFYLDTPLLLETVSSLAEQNVMEKEEKYRVWKEFHMRFEDIKLHPKQELMKICDRFGIAWSDELLRSTKEGITYLYHQEVRDFDLRPVLNNYEEYLSAFDRFRISLIARPYQKRYGYAYEDSMSFSRSELQEMFLKPFRFQKGIRFESERERIKYYRNAYEVIRWDLWEARKHEVLDDIIPIFEKVELYESVYKERRRTEEIQRLIDFVRQQDKLVLYGIGRDCEGLLSKLGIDRPEVIFCDLKATYKDIDFQGKKVIAPTELNGQYGSYKILVTSSMYYSCIRDQLEHLFEIDSDRIICNVYQLWEGE